MPYSVKCITMSQEGSKDHPYDAIHSLTIVDDESGNQQRVLRSVLHDDIVNGRKKVYCDDNRGHRVPVLARLSPNRTKYVTTAPDSTKADNLLSRPRCE